MNREECGTFDLETLKMRDFVCGDLLPFICEIKEGIYKKKN